jgi:predicted RNA polymerase sigma factor
LYDQLYDLKPTPIIALNRAVAIGMAHGAAAGLEAIDAVAAEPVLANYHILPSVRADFLLKVGRPGEARAELERAVALASNGAERDLLLRRLANIAS